MSKRGSTARVPRTLDAIKRDLSSQVIAKHPREPLLPSETLNLVDSLDAVLGSFSESDLSGSLDTDLSPKLSLSTLWLIGRAAWNAGSLMTVVRAFKEKGSRNDFLSYPATWEYILSKGSVLGTFIKTNQDFFARILDKRSGLGIPVSGIDSHERNVVKEDLVPLLTSILNSASSNSHELSTPLCELIVPLITPGGEKTIQAKMERVMETATNPLFSDVFASDSNLEHLSNILVRAYDVAHRRRDNIESKLTQAREVLKSIEELGDTGTKTELRRIVNHPKDLVAVIRTKLESERSRDEVRILIEDDAIQEILRSNAANPLYARVYENGEVIRALEARERVRESDKSSRKHTGYENDQKIIGDIIFAENVDAADRAGFTRERFVNLQPLVKTLIKSSIGDETARQAVVKFVSKLTTPYPDLSESATEGQKIEHARICRDQSREFWSSIGKMLEVPSLQTALSNEENLRILTDNLMPALEGIESLKPYIGESGILSRSSGLASKLVRSIVEDPEQIRRIGNLINAENTSESIDAIRSIMNSERLQQLVTSDEEASRQLSTLISTLVAPISSEELVEERVQVAEIIGEGAGHGDLGTSAEELRVQTRTTRDASSIVTQIKESAKSYGIVLQDSDLSKVSPFIGQIISAAVKPEQSVKVLKLVEILITPKPVLTAEEVGTLPAEDQSSLLQLRIRESQTAMFEAISDIITDTELKPVILEHIDALSAVVMQALEGIDNLKPYIGESGILSRSSGLASKLVRSIVEDPEQIRRIGNLINAENSVVSLRAIRSIIESEKLQELVVEDEAARSQLSELIATVVVSDPVIDNINASLEGQTFRLNKEQFKSMKPLIEGLVSSALTSRSSDGKSNLSSFFELVIHLTNFPSDDRSFYEEYLPGIYTKSDSLLQLPAFRERLSEDSNVQSLMQNLVPMLESMAYVGERFIPQRELIEIAGSDQTKFIAGPHLIDQTSLKSQEMMRAVWKSLVRDDGQAKRIREFIYNSKTTKDYVTKAEEILSQTNVRELVLNQDAIRRDLSKVVGDLVSSNNIVIMVNKSIKGFQRDESKSAITLEQTTDISTSLSVLVDTMLSKDSSTEKLFKLAKDALGETVILEEGAGAKVSYDIRKILSSAKEFLSDTSIKRGLQESKIIDVSLDIAMPLANNLKIVDQLFKANSLPELDFASLKGVAKDTITLCMDKPELLDDASKILGATTLSEKVKLGMEVIDKLQFTSDVADSPPVTLVGRLAREDNVIKFASKYLSSNILKTKGGEVSSDSLDGLSEDLFVVLQDVLPKTDRVISEICSSEDARNIIANTLQTKTFHVSDISKLLSMDSVKLFVCDNLTTSISGKRDSITRIVANYSDKLPVSPESITSILSDRNAVRKCVDIFDDYSNSRKTKAVFKAIGLFFASSSLRGVVFSAVKKKFQSKPSETKNGGKAEAKQPQPKIEGKAEEIESGKVALVEAMQTKTPPATSFLEREKERASKGGEISIT
jgi:hypothetical protein